MLWGTEYLTFAELRKRLGITKNELHGLIERGALTPAISYRGRAYVWRGDDIGAGRDTDVDLRFVYLEWPNQRGPHRYSFEYGGEVYPPAGNVAEALKLRFTGDDINQDYVEMHGCFFMHLVEHVEWLRRMHEIADKVRNKKSSDTSTSHESRTHKAVTRSHPLNPVIELARKNALSPDDESAVWAAMVALAQLPDKECPEPLIGFVKDKGIRYRKANGDMVTISRKAFGERLRRILKSLARPR